MIKNNIFDKKKKSHDLAMGSVNICGLENIDVKI